MSINEDRIKYLLEQYAGNVATENEVNELFSVIKDSEHNALLKDWLAEAIQEVEPAIEYDQERWDRVIGRIVTSPVRQMAVHRIHFLRTIRWWAAASIILLMGAGTYFLVFNKSGKQAEIVETQSPRDIKAPETNRATVTLANGQQVFLDSVTNGQLAIQGDVKLVKLADGQIAYQNATGQIEKEMQFNTLFNPRGSKVIDMTLSDGSRVWLNSGSSVTYPVAFVGNERKVIITGEAYFEVAKDKTKPFHVKVNDMEVLALGTEFNINAYSDEDKINTTLVEGIVKVSKGTVNTVLKPGQQSQLKSDGQLSIIKEVNIDEIMAWKDGIFHFESADLKSILRQFSRWYDIEVIYEGSVKNRKFFAIVKRSSTLKSVLEMLQDNDIVYRIEGKKLIVKSG